MKIFNSTALPKLTEDQQQCVYNALDALLTFEIYEQSTDDLALDSYKYEMSTIGPILTMIRRGIKIDEHHKQLVLHGDPDAHDKKLKLGLVNRAYALGGMTRKQLKRGGKWLVTDSNALIQDLAHTVWQKELNYHSDKQLKEFFYEALKIPPVIASKKGQAKVSCDRNALEKIKKTYPRGAIFASIILLIRDLEKQSEALSQDLSPEGRWCASYNPAGTDTWRWSSSNNPLGHSANVQNINPELRRAFVSDPGFTLFNADQQGAEARAVAYLSGDEAYIKAVESGDVHTMVASMTWGFEAKRELADREFYRGFSYRDMCKKLAHGSAYGGTAPTLANQSTIDLSLVEDFQRRFFKMFPGIRSWQDATIREVQIKGRLTTPFNFTRRFWGRLDDESTWRAAIAFRPQCIVGVTTAKALRILWDLYEPRVQILANGHDAVLGQVRDSDVEEFIPKVLDAIIQPIDVTDCNGQVRTMTIPWDAKIGKNWGDPEIKDGKIISNFEGLQKWKKSTKS